MTNLVIATYNRADLLIPQLHKLIKNRTIESLNKVLVYDNGVQKNSGLYEITHPKIQIINQGWNAGCSITWNQGLENSFKDPQIANVIVYNDDCEWYPDPIFLRTQIGGLKREHFFLSKTKGYTSFLVTREVYNKIKTKYGYFFDEKFYPAYYEDNDISIRLKLNLIKEKPMAFLEPKVFRGSQTIKKDPKVNKNFEKNKQYYINKWGGLPDRELLSWDTFKAHAKVDQTSRILVIGPQKSGTKFTTKVIAEEYRLTPIYEETTGSYWRQAQDWVSKAILSSDPETSLKGKVIQAPHLTYFAGDFSPEFDYIIFMWRDSSEIAASAKRINWGPALQAAEWEPYKTAKIKEGIEIWDYKKKYFADHRPQNAFYLRYDSIPGLKQKEL